MTKRKPWPKYVNVSNKVYLNYRPRITKELEDKFNADEHGFLKPPIKLGKISDGETKILQRYLAAKKAFDSEKSSSQESLGEISKLYKKSRQFKSLSAGAQQNYTRASKVLGHVIEIKGNLTPLSELPVARLSKPLLQAIIERRLEAYKKRGLSGASMLNYEVAYVSSMLSWATNYIPDIKIKRNPLIGFKKLKETPVKRYVTDEEYNIQYAQVTGHLYLAVFFELSYLCAFRSIEGRNLNLSSIKTEGMLIERRKGSKDNIIKWTPRLRKAVDWTIAHRTTPKITGIDGDEPLFTNSQGERLTRSGLLSSMRTLKSAMNKKGLGDVYFSLHLLKHKGITDAENKNIGGHKTERMKAIYDHSTPQIEPPK